MKNKGAKGLEVTLDNPAAKLSFAGLGKRENGEEDEGDNEGMRFVVAVVDRKSKRAEILPPSSGMLVKMHHSVKGFVPLQPEDHSLVNRGTYVREFASHREHKRLKEYSDAYIAADSLKVGSEMDKARATHRAELDSLKREQKAAVPPHDASTTEATGVYSVAGLCDEALRGALSALMWARFEAVFASEEADVLSTTLEGVDPNARPFFEQVLVQLHKAESDEEKEGVVVALGFALACACFLQDEHPRRGERGTRSTLFAAQAPEYGKVRRLMNECFGLKATDARRYDLDEAGRIRAVNYGVVAMVLASSARQVDVAHVCSLYGLVTSMAKQHVTAVGCKSANGTKLKDALVYQLIAPLKLPSMTQRVTKKKK